MSSQPVEKKKRNWSAVAGAFGRAHRKAKVELEGSAPLLDHLNELRVRIFKAFFALIIATGISFAFSEQIIRFLAEPIGGIQNLVSIELTENISIFMKVSLLGGFVLAMPIIVYQILAFVMPGLKGNEGRWLIVIVPFAGLLFATGVVFTWYMLLPSAIPFLQKFMGITTQVRPQNYFEFITRLMFWIGVCFEMPLVVMFLARIGMVTGKQLLSGWRYAIVLMAILSAAITPTVDPVNMGLVMAPLMALYLISIIMAAIFGRKRDG